MRTRGISALLALTLLLPDLSHAQASKKAQVGFRFLENPVSAEVIGRGEVGVATTSGADGIFWNPSMISRGTRTVDVTLHHAIGFADIGYNAAAASVQLGSWGGVIGASLMAMDYGTFYGTRRAANDAGYEETGEFSPSAFALGLAFAQRVSERFSYGVHVKYTSQDLGSAWVAPIGASLSDPDLILEQRSYSASVLALDVGAVYDFQYNGIMFGAVLQNISKEIQYENEKFPLPFAVSFGATVQPLLFFLPQDPDQVLILSFESRHPRDYQERVKFGAEFRFLETFSIRAGYMLNYDLRGFTAGIGLERTFGDFPLRLNYAYQPVEVFGATHFISLGVQY